MFLFQQMLHFRRRIPSENIRPKSNKSVEVLFSTEVYHLTALGPIQSLSTRFWYIASVSFVPPCLIITDYLILSSFIFIYHQLI
jgi:hypothetical protein